MGEFPDGTPFRLNGLEVYEELNGLTFAQLGEAQQETIKDYALSIHTIGRQSQPDFVFEVFERLNMGATQLNEQELRNCIYQGGYTELLGALVSNPHLLQIYKAQAPHLRMRDRELLLRFFALLRAGPAGFCSPVKAWLNAEMRARRELPAEEAASMRAAFERAIQLSWEVFGENAFRPVREGAAGEPPSFDVGEVNVALWDTVMYSMAFADRARVLARKEAVLAAFMALAGDSKFKRLLVSQPKAVIARSEAWAKVLERVLA